MFPVGIGNAPTIGGTTTSEAAPILAVAHTYDRRGHVPAGFISLPHSDRDRRQLVIAEWVHPTR